MRCVNESHRNDKDVYKCYNCESLFRLSKEDIESNRAEDGGAEIVCPACKAVMKYSSEVADELIQNLD